MIDTNSDEMASFEVLHQNSSGSFDGNDFSFLQEASTVNLPNGTGHLNPNFNLTNTHSALDVSPDKVVEEVHSHLMELLEENQSLKESLNKNNSMMREQMNTISSWREQMIQSRAQQQEKLQKAKEKIADLEKQNAELNEKVIVFEKKIEELEANTSKCQLEDIQHNKSDGNGESKTNELEESYPSEIPDCMDALQFLEKVVDENKFIGSKKKYCENILSFFKDKLNALEECNTVIQTDEENGYEIIHQKNVNENSSRNEELENLKKTVESQNNQLDCLKKEKEELLLKLEASEAKLLENEKLKKEMFLKLEASEAKLQETEQVLKMKFEEVNNKDDTEASLVEKYRERCESLQQQVNVNRTKLEQARKSDSHIVQELQEEIKDLQKILKIEQVASQKDKEKIKEMLMRFENLQVDYDSQVKRLLENHHKDLQERDEEIEKLKKIEADVYVQIVNLNEQVQDLSLKLEKKTKEFEEFQKEHSACNEAFEEIPILKCQIEIYKQDVESTLAQKTLADEKIESLTNELKRYEGGSSNSSPRDARRKHRHDKKSNEGKPFFECPMCSMGFYSENDVQNHVERCLNESS